MRTNIHKLLFGFLFIMAVFSCSKNETNPDTPDAKPINKLNISNNFTWETTKTVTLETGVNMVNSIGNLVLINIYDNDPSLASTLLISGSAGYNLPFKSELCIPSYLTKIWITATSHKGVKQTAIVDVATTITYYFEELEGRYKKNEKSLITEPPCEGDIQISGNSSVTITGGKTYLINGSYNGNINFASAQGGGTLVICGNATINSLNLDNNCKVQVTSAGTLSCSNLNQSGTSQFEVWGSATASIGQFNQNGNSGKFTNYSANLTITNSTATAGLIYNYGTMIIGGSMNLNNNGNLYNYGNLSVSGSLNINQNLENYGNLTVAQNMQFNTTSTYVNNCQIIVSGNINLNAGTLTMTEGYLSTPYLTINGSGNLLLINKSMLSVGNMMVNNNILASGSKSSIISTGTSTINGGSKINGPVEWADNDKVLQNGNSSNFINGSTFVKIADATNVIPKSTCNPEGIGIVMSPDADGDGVTDTEDAYPTDATRAFNSFYPNQANYASLAFEDLWPATGDYDFNDLVVKFQYQTISNGTNKVVQLKCKYEVTAVGAGFINGFGVQFDNLTPQLVASVTGQVLGAGYIALSPNGTEAGQEKTVIIPWDNVELVINRNGGSMFNTIPGSNQGTAVPVEINIFFSTPIETSLLGTAPYNPFLIGQMNRGHEIHLADHLPTSLMDLTLLGTSSDKSIPLQGRYFRTQSNLPWAISVPAVLDHPAEKIMVTDAYLKFSSWAESSGSQYSDWYINKPGYRNSSNIW